MRVVISGSQGFVGRHLLARLGDGCEVLALGRTPTGDPGPGRYHQFELDDPVTLLPRDWRGLPFTLVHLAWDTSRPRSFDAYARHVRAVAGLLDHWGPQGLERVVMAGTAEEYGRRSGRLAEDQEPVGPLTPYGWGKRASRELLTNWSAVTGAPVVWLRPFIVYGPGQVGEMALPYALRQARRGLPADLSGGDQLRDFVYVADVVDAVLRALRVDAPGCHEFNIGTGEGARLRDVLEYMADLCGARHLFRFGVRPYRPGEPMEQVADRERALRVLGWAPTVSWRDGVRRAVAAGEGYRWTA